ncbi:sulfotransferase [Pseudoalteromonas fenneropenaei]|uniref:Sulfotransferase n=1 Tax=Pseudoalteromonas fenneropenaei TaxID=1737459 RepID=A0ABV7CFJ2_9GAMM
MKTLIVGLPRTGTTSLCIATTQLGYKTAHTAYTQQALQQAEVIADTPVFHDFARLAAHFQACQFIYLTRSFDLWLPSIRKLLSRMQARLMTQQGGFNDTIKRCYLETFGHFTAQDLASDDYLISCYQRHQQRVSTFMAKNNLRCLTLALEEERALEQLKSVLPAKPGYQCDIMPRSNINGKVTAWKDHTHPLVIPSTRDGKADKDSQLLNFE